jgi:hypothetical protein
VNHACVSNAAHWYEDDYRVKILFSEKAIKAGDEITFSYLSHRSLHMTYNQQVIAGILQISWGIICPEGYLCFSWWGWVVPGVIFNMSLHPGVKFDPYE